MMSGVAMHLCVRNSDGYRVDIETDASPIHRGGLNKQRSRAAERVEDDVSGLRVLLDQSPNHWRMKLRRVAKQVMREPKRPLFYDQLRRHRRGLRTLLASRPSGAASHETLPVCRSRPDREWVRAARDRSLDSKPEPLACPRAC